jgi:ABC-type glycerol-3-phosphate transport system substrate-binding protein
LIKHKVQPTADEITALHGGATTGNVFFSGKVGMQVFYSSTDRLPFRWGLATLPYSGPAGSKNTSGRFFCHGLHMGQVKEKDAVWEVFKWLTKPENGGRFVVTAGHATSPIVNGGSDAAQKTYQERAGVDARAYVLMAQSVRVEGHGVYKYATSGQVLTTIGEFYKQMRDGKMSVDEYADRAAGIMNQQLVPPKR